MLLSTISFIYHTNLFKGRKYPTPESTLFLVEERLDFRGGGGKRWRYISEGTKYVHYAKRGPFYGSVSTLLSLIIVFKKLLGDNLSVRYFLYKNLFSLKFEKGYYFIKSKKKIVRLGYTFIRALKAFLP